MDVRPHGDDNHIRQARMTADRPQADWPHPIDFVQEALFYRGYGWSVFPIKGDKRPAVGWKRLQCRRPTDRQIGTMFRRTRAVNGVAVVLGWVSNHLAVRDFDDRPSYRRWAVRNPRIA